MSLSRVRWGLAGLLALIGLAAAMSALRTYAEHGLVMGIGAVGSLAIITVAGMASLGFARRRIHNELTALEAKVPGGSLYTERKLRLEAIKASGARPDLHALAEASSAREASRAYLGRYLVATTVLVGLVGTFAGLMETLGKVAPLLADDGAGKALSLLAAPLSGLHVTFGASLVAIVVTLALSLAQGDLVLHEERALATLEDLTHHTLVPLLWPPAADANERTVRVLEGLHTEIAQAVAGALKQATETLSKSQDERLTLLAKELAAGAKQMSESVGTHATQTAEALAKTTLQVEERVRGLTEAVSQTLVESTKNQVKQVTDAVAYVAERLTKSADIVVVSLGKHLEVSGSAASKRFDDAAIASTLVAEQMAIHLQKVLATAERHLETAAENSVKLTSQALSEAQAERKALAQEVSSTVSVLIDTVKTTASASLERTGRAVSESAKALSDTLAPLFTAESEERKLLAATLAQNLSELHTLVHRANEVSSTLGAQAQTTSAALAETGDKVVESLAQSTRTHSDAIGRSNAGAVERLNAATEHARLTLAGLADEVGRSLGQTAQELLSSLGSHTQTTQELVAETSRSLSETVNAMALRAEAGLGETGRLMGERLDAVAAQSQAGLAETNRVVTEASLGLIEQMGSMAARSEALLSGLGQQTAAAVQGAVKGHAETLELTAKTVVSGLGETMRHSGERMESAAGKLVEATRTMNATLEPLQPRLDALTAELERLTHEVAVMAAHADAAHGSAVVMAELERMGDGLERLASLVRLAREPEPEALELQEAHS